MNLSVKKAVLAQLPGVYAVGLAELVGEQYVTAASENRKGESVIIHAQTHDVLPLSGGPGGVMALVPAPGEDAVLSIEEFYPIFDSAMACIVKSAARRNANGITWQRTTLATLPWVHRIALLREPDGTYLAAGTLCEYKNNQEDWSNPGRVHIGRYTGGAIRMDVVLDGIVKHHAMYVKQNENGWDDLYVGGENGVFHLTYAGNQRWNTQKIAPYAASDICLYDLDGDGQEELILIEGFHGNRIHVLKPSTNSYDSIVTCPLPFGHVLWGGTVCKRPCLIAAGRSGAKELALYHLTKKSGRDEMEKLILDVGVGASQIAVRETPRATEIFSANHAQGTVSLYTIQELRGGTL